MRCKGVLGAICILSLPVIGGQAIARVGARAAASGPLMNQSFQWHGKTTTPSLPPLLRPRGNVVYPQVADSLVWIGQKGLSSDGAANDGFGYSISIDGDTAVIGAPGAAVNSNSGQGAVYVFKLSKGNWTQVAKLVANDGAASDAFGSAVALSGSTLVVGAPYASSSAGAAYVFTNGSGTWTQAQKLTASDAAANSNFGWSVAVSGSTAVVSAPAVHLLQGEAYVFQESGGTWAQTAALTASDGTILCDFGSSVAVSGDTVLIGSNAYPGNGQYLGAAYVFSDSSGSWTQAQELTPNDSAIGDFFGYSVALDGPTALIGAYYKNFGTGYGQGAAYVFTESAGSWSQAQELQLGNGVPGDYFGLAVSLSGDKAFVSAPHVAVDGTPDIGAVFEFDNSNGTWTQGPELAPGDGVSGDYFGNYVSANGGTAVVGMLDATVGGNSKQGAAYFYGESDLALNLSVPKHITPGGNYVNQTMVTNNSTAASPAVAVTVAVPAAASFVSAQASQGSCAELSGVVTCNFGSIAGNAGMASANITFTANASLGDTIVNTASIKQASPALTTSVPIAVTANTPPVADDGTLKTKQNQPANGTLQATDAESDPLVFSIVQQPTHGTIVLNNASMGAYTYTPDKGYSGKDSFTFKANDGEADSNIATVSIKVQSTSSGGGAYSPLGLVLLLLFAMLAGLLRRRHQLVK